MQRATGFHLVSSNRLDWLARRLCERLRRAPEPLSLQADTVLIPQPTLRRWLQAELARELGIAANLDFPTPSEWVWRLLRAAHPDLPVRSPWDADALRWRLFALLGDAQLPDAVHDYLQRSGNMAAAERLRDGSALSRWNLAQALASAFDRYQAYRRQWLEAWEHGRDAAPDLRSDDWQAQLWRRLRAQTKVPPRSQLLGDWLRRFDGTGEAPPGLPPRLSAFGTIHVSPDVLRMLAVAAQHCDLEFHRPSPCEEYWGDVESLRARLQRDGADALPAALAETQHDNPLLQAWGAAGRDFVAQLFSYELVQPDSEREGFAAPPRDTLLHALQADVLQRAAPQVLPSFDANDASVQIHACHSRLREVEVLHDRLLDLLNRDETLQPSDIAVLAPNIGDYLPLVRAVFGGVERDAARFIPFTLSDRPQAQSHPLVGLFLALLELRDSRRTVSEIRDLLAVPAVMAALHFAESDLQRLDAWFAAAGIRWGDDEAMRAQLGFGRWREYSFDFGIDRLLLGYASGEIGDVGEDGDVGGIAPFAQLEGADAQRLDGLLRVLDVLRELSAWQRAPHAASEWRQRLGEDFLALLPKRALDDAESGARRTVLEALKQFAEQAGDTGLLETSALPLDVVAAALRESLEAPSPHQPFLGGGVTFAGMVPLRTVPFKAICLLGMDADAFPRREPGGDVNRMLAQLRGGARKLGDRSVREDDRFLFLQLLSAASDVFYISYGGRDARDGSVREPSALVSELLDAAQRHFPADADARKRLCIEHPLQPFSAQAFGAEDARRFSYRGEWRQPVAATRLRVPQDFVAAPLPPREDDDGEFDLDALQRFFANPPRHFLRRRLDLALPRIDADDEDREPLGDNALQMHRLVSTLLHEELDDAALRARGLLPPGRDGARVALEARERVRPLRGAMNEWQGEGRRAVALAGSLKGKHWLRALLEHIALAAQQGERVQTRVFFNGDKGVESRDAPRLSREDAQARLDDLRALMREGETRPLPFMPDSAFACIEKLAEKNDVREAWKAALAAFDGYRGGDSDDAWVQLAFRPRAMLEDFDAERGREFRALAQRIFEGKR